ncbi:MAG TPA: DUF2235 domain-containing protein [Bryobacteraceae bacterium]
MAKNIVLCFDGTGNGFEDPNTDSNVVKLYSSLAIDANQIGYYHPGVGTMGAPNALGWAGKQWSRIKGLAFGAGLLGIVGDAYRYLMDTYADGDRIFVFGFSRGAYTARAFASVLHIFGLLCAGNQGCIPYILRMYSKRTRLANRKEPGFETDEPFKWEFSHGQGVRIHFCGLWDTVSSYGWIYHPVRLPFEERNPIVDIGRHAISIDERRCYFQDNLWGQSYPGQDIRQVWFCGVHSDVGGSYPENESGLSKIPLEWLFVEAEKAGVRINSQKAKAVLGSAKPHPPIQGLPQYVEPDPSARRHNSLHGKWWVAEFLPHLDPQSRGFRLYMPLGRRRKIPLGSLIHESVLLSKWKPLNLPEHTVEPWVHYGEDLSQIRPFLGIVSQTP